MITAFEIVESIRFFAQLVATEGISEETKKKANKYIDKLVTILEKDVEATLQSRSDIKVVKGG